MKLVMINCLILLKWLLISSCNTDAPGSPLSGKILVEKGDSCFVYIDSDTPMISFKLRDDKGIKYHGLDWLNTKDAFIGNEDILGMKLMEFRENIVVFNLSGEIIDRIYEAEEGEIAWPLYSSWDDKYLIFTSEQKLDPEKFALDGIGPTVSLAIINIEQKKVIEGIDSIEKFPNFQIEESPWLHGDGYRFLYSINIAPSLRDEGKLFNPKGVTEGVYIFDVKTGKSDLLIPSGFSAVVSPVTNQIVFERDYSVIVRDMNTNKDRIIYKYKSNEVLMSKHWTPDGRSIYFSYINRSSISDIYNKYGEKLIEVSSGKKLPFKSIGMKYESYTWK